MSTEDQVSLASLWEAEVSLRQRARETGRLTAWRNSKLVGLASVDAMTYNLTLLEVLATYWTARSDLPKAVPIGVVRPEVGFDAKSNLILR